MKSPKGFRPAILHPVSLCTLLLLTLTLIVLVEIACLVLPSSDQDVFDVPQRRSIDPIWATRQDVIDQSVTMTVIDNLSNSVTPQPPEVRHHLERDAKPHGTSAPKSGAFFHNQPTGVSSSPSHTVLSITTSSQTSTPTPTSAPPPSAFVQSSTGSYFVGAYLPTILAVFFSIPWIILNQTVNSMEPFYRLSANSSVLAESALTINFVSFSSVFHALKKRHWTVLISTLLMLSSISIIPIASETVSIKTLGECDHTTKGCRGVIRVLVPGARVIQAILAIMSISSITLIVLMWRRRIKVLSDPRSIAGLASIFLDPAMRRDFKEVGATASKTTLMAALSGNTYKLSTMTRYDGVNFVSIVKTRGQQITPVQGFSKHDYSNLDWNQSLQHSPRYRLPASILFLLLLVLEALIIAYRYTGGDTPFENFMSGQGFGVRFLFTCIGITISLYWGRVFQMVALIAPYSSLAEGNASARESILITPPAHPLLALHTSVSARHFVFVAVTIVAVLSQILTVTLATIPFKSAHSWTSYVSSTWISVFIIALMLVVLILLFFYHEPMLPIKPDTVASHLVYLADSSLPDMFAGLAMDEMNMMRKKIEGLGLRYRLRRAREVAGMLAVDVEDTGPHDAIMTQM